VEPDRGSGADEGVRPTHDWQDLLNGFPPQHTNPVTRISPEKPKKVLIYVDRFSDHLLIPVSLQPESLRLRT
jgi:hypothetical protein